MRCSSTSTISGFVQFLPESCYLLAHVQMMCYLLTFLLFHGLGVTDSKINNIGYNIVINKHGRLYFDLLQTHTFGYRKVLILWNWTGEDVRAVLPWQSTNELISLKSPGFNPSSNFKLAEDISSSNFNNC